MTLIVNASHWHSLSNKMIAVYSANQHSTLNDLIKAPEPKYRKLGTAFAYVVVNLLTQEIIAARDPMGLEAFYYYYRNQKFIFGSSIPDILNQLTDSALLNCNQVIDLFTNGLVGEQTYSDDTYYQDIYRVEPGYVLQIRKQQLQKKVFWQLELDAPTIELKNDSIYLEHFSILMSEALQCSIGNQPFVATEFSGGLDSSSILMACHQNGIEPSLFCHIAPPDCLETDDREYANTVIQQFQFKKVHWVDAQYFNLIEVLHYCAACFAGAAPYLFFMLANNIHQAVINASHSTLLSGFGGDECVSGHAPMRAYLPSVMRGGLYKKAWQELLYSYHHGNNNYPPRKIKCILHLLKLSHPWLHYFLSKIGNIDQSIQAYLKSKPYFPQKQKKIYHSVRDYEYDLLQGPRSQHLRMRIEYSAVLAKSMGFTYSYPLLYPKLVDFCFRLPLEQKRRNGVNRYLIRQYIAKSLSSKVYNKHLKTGSIMPATMQKCKEYARKGLLDPYFKDLPYIEKVDKNLGETEKLAAKIYAYMFKYYLFSCSR